MKSGTYMGAAITAAALTFPSLAFPTVAAAQTGNESTYGDIVVTAQKREERLQDVPLAVSAVSGDMIADRGFANISQLSQMTPNVNLSEGIVNPTVIVPFIRGIGTVDNSPESDTPVAVSIDGVYLASIYGGLIDAFDIQQVEILRGPQGTLQGRNAPGGAVNITTRRPGAEWTGRAMFQYGRFNDIRMNIGMDGPLIEDVLGVKLAFMRRKADGFSKNITTGERFGGRDTYAFKAGLELTPGDRLNIWLGGDYTKDKSEPTAFRDMNDGIAHPRPEYSAQLPTLACTIFGACTPSRRYTTGQSKFDDNYVRNWGLVSNINYDADAVTLTSITGYRKIRDDYYLDIDATPYPLLETMPSSVRQKTFSQEFRIASNDGGPLSFNNHVRWMIGAYYMEHDFVRDQALFAFGNDIGIDYAQDLTAKAIFGNVDIMPTEQLTLSFGARQNWDKKDFENFTSSLTATAKWKKFVFDASVNYKFTPDHMAYFRFARGSRPGGWNQTVVTYNPETVDSWEGGVKTQWLDRRLTLNLTGFYYKYSDIQRQTSVVLPDGSFVRATGNAGKSHAYGLEVELVARPIDNLNINFGLGYLKAKYDEWIDVDLSSGIIYDNSTLPVFQAPKWTINGGISYTVPVSDTGIVGAVIPAVNVYHKSAHYTNTEAQPVAYENGYTLLNASLKFRDPSERFALTFFADNILDNYYINNGGSLGGLSLYVQDAPPRTYGIRFEMEIR